MTPLLAQQLRTDRSFERMYRRYAADVYHYALAICRNETDAEDVTQTTFMNAYRAVQAGEQPRAPKNWLIAIAHNVCRQRFRQAARRPSEVELDDGVAAFVPDEEGPSAEDIRRALGELAFNQRAALVMRELEGRSYAEIAEILGVSVSAVETLIFRARRALREQLEGSLTCHEAELALSKQLDGRLSRAEKGALRAHLRSCKECASFARSQRAQRSALKALAAIPLPSSLASLFGGGGATVGTALATKAAAVTAVGLLVTGAGVETVKQHPWRRHAAVRHTAAAPAQPVARAAQPQPAAAAPQPRSAARPAYAGTDAKPNGGHDEQTPADGSGREHGKPTDRGVGAADQGRPAEQDGKQKAKDEHKQKHEQKAKHEHKPKTGHQHGKRTPVPPDQNAAEPSRTGGDKGSTPGEQRARRAYTTNVPLVRVDVPRPHVPKRP